VRCNAAEAFLVLWEKEQSEDPTAGCFWSRRDWSVPHGKRVFFRNAGLARFLERMGRNHAKVTSQCINFVKNN